MSVKAKLEQLTAPVEPGRVTVAPARPPVDPQPAAAPRVPAPKTGPGSMMRFLQDQSDSDERIQQLSDRLKEFEDALPVRRLDPARIRLSQLANRHEDHFKRAGYQQLVEDIASANGNVQPIRVRPIKEDPAHDYEVVFGHRRLRACQQLGLQVNAMVSSDNDTALFEAMCRENSAREDLTAFEEGMSYRRALDMGLYGSQRKLAAAIGVTQARISQVISVASLPTEVLATFPSPLDVQYRWAEALHMELQADRNRLFARLKDLASQKSLSARQVFEYLTAKPQAASVDVVVEGKKRAVIRSSHGVISVAFSKNSLPEGRMAELQDLLARFLRLPGALPPNDAPASDRTV